MMDFSEFGESLAQKLEALVARHRQFVSEFERSLNNSNHFVALADRSMEEEPDSTLSMLSQLLEIDLLGHLQRLAEEFSAVLDYVETSPLAEGAEPYRDELGDLAKRYEWLEEQAVEQVTRVETLIRALET